MRKTENHNKYLRGFSFWDKNRFWDSPLYSNKSKSYFNRWLEDMRSNEKVFTKLT